MDSRVDALPKHWALVVENHSVTRDEIRVLLLTLGFEVACAHTICEAVRLLNKHPVDPRLLVDLDLPDGSGVDLILYARRTGWSGRAGSLTEIVAPQQMPPGVEKDDVLIRRPIHPAQLIAWADSCQGVQK
jgi:CheY-like chemotaxis protein